MCRRTHGFIWSVTREAAALKIEPPLLGRMKLCLRCDGFFSFAVVRQIVLLLKGLCSLIF